MKAKEEKPLEQVQLCMPDMQEIFEGKAVLAPYHAGLLAVQAYSLWYGFASA
jgi:hypothetical protein